LIAPRPTPKLEDHPSSAGRKVTVNSARYSEMLRTFLELVLQRLGAETQTLWFQQDGATAHNVRTAVRVLYEMFRPRVSHEEGILNGLKDKIGPVECLKEYVRNVIYIQAA